MWNVEIPLKSAYVYVPTAGNATSANVRCLMQLLENKQLAGWQNRTSTPTIRVDDSTKVGQEYT